MRNIHLFTSITSNYIPKARTLAYSIKTFHPDYAFHLMLCDELPHGFDLADEPFDSIISIQDLSIQNEKSWIFMHNVVELCTAVKGLAFQKILELYQPEGVFYFDPDIVVFSPLKELTDSLSKSSILLTPHLTKPESTPQAILDNEVCSLRHGVYNLGFLGVKNSAAGHNFLAWWSSRLFTLCYDDKVQGIFTDQRWADLIPAFFDDYTILRSPAYNVATWNLTHRKATGSLESGISINGEPLCFYHFSGFDSGAQQTMLEIYGTDSPLLFDLRQWYIQECRRNGQDEFGCKEYIYSRFSNGEKISDSQRRLYRTRQDLQAAFPNPFDVGETDKSFLDWYKNEVAVAERPDDRITTSLRDIQASRTWRLANKIRALSGRKPFNLSGFL
jgi:lipopolysaccharide biosynthesis glycosyltransferase